MNNKLTIATILNPTPQTTDPTNAFKTSTQLQTPFILIFIRDILLLGLPKVAVRLTAVGMHLLKEVN